jgi:hypothetical protein
MMGYMDHAYLVQTELAAESEFQHRLPKYQERLIDYIDTLFAVAYFVDSKGLDPDDWFPYIAWERLALVPYSFRAVSILAYRGYNPEGYMVLRQVLEAFVQLRYFSVHRSLLRPHLEAKTPKDRVTFKTMFEELSPGYYSRYYSLASGVAHAGVHLSVMSGMTMDAVAKKLNPPLGCEFNEKKASVVVNQSLVLMLGFLVQVPSWSPTYLENVAAKDPSVEARRLAAIDKLEEWRTGHRATVPSSHEWIDKSMMLIGKS